MKPDQTPVLIRGAGELASAVAWTLHGAGFPVVMTELAAPLSVRRRVCFSEAVRLGNCHVAGVGGQLCGGAPADRSADRVAAIKQAWERGAIAIVIDHGLSLPSELQAFAIIDARMRKRGISPIRGMAQLTMALGPAVTAGEQVDVVIETQRGPLMGQVIRKGEAIPDSGTPGEVGGESRRRLCRAPVAGIFEPRAEIGDIVVERQLLGIVLERPAPVSGQVSTSASASVSTLTESPNRGTIPEPVREHEHRIEALIPGLLRGLVASGTTVRAGEKVGDVDPRGESVDPEAISDKGHAVAAGVLSALQAAMNKRGD
jgi:xanthine dehydrogenase accessory factor